MSYQRFDLAAALGTRETPPATVATAATVTDAARESVATVAELPSNPIVAAGRQDTNSLNPQPTPGLVQSLEVWGAEDWQAYFDERAAVREYSAGLPPGDAELLAFEDALVQWLVQNPAPRETSQMDVCSVVVQIASSTCCFQFCAEREVTPGYTISDMPNGDTPVENWPAPR